MLLHTFYVYYICTLILSDYILYLYKNKNGILTFEELVRHKNSVHKNGSKEKKKVEARNK